MTTLASLVADLALRTASFTRGWGEAVAATRQSTAAITRQTREIQRGFDNVGRELTRVTRLVDTAKLAFAALGGAYVVRDIVQTAAAFENLNLTLTTVFGSSRRAAEEFAYTQELADRLGQNLQNTTQSYAQLAAAAQGTALAGQATRDIFEAVTGTMAVLGRNAEQTSGALTAIEQIMSKGTLSAEELRQQLGERLPGAFQIMARALDISVEELNDKLKQGAIGAEEALTAFAAQLNEEFPGIAERIETAQASLNRFSTAMQLLKVEFARSGFLEGFLEGLEDLQRALSTPEMREAAQNLGRRLGDAFRFAGEAIQFVGEHLDELIALTATYISYRVADAAVGIATAFARVATALQAATGAHLALNAATRANLIAVGIGAAVGAAIYFKDTMVEIGGATVSVGRITSAVWEGISNQIAAVGRFMAAVFEGIETYVNAVFDGIIERFNGLKTAYQGILSLDFGAVAQGLGQAASGAAGEYFKMDPEALRASFAAAGEAAAKAFTAPFEAAGKLQAELEAQVKERFGGVAGAIAQEVDLINATFSQGPPSDYALALADEVDAINKIVPKLAEVASEGGGIEGLTQQASAFEQRMIDVGRTVETLQAQLTALPSVGVELGRLEDIQAAQDAMLQWADANGMTAASFAEIEAAAAQAGITVEALAAKFAEQRNLEFSVTTAIDLTQQEQQLNLIAQHGGRLTEEYRIQAQLLEYAQRSTEAIAESFRDQVTSNEQMRTDNATREIIADMERETELLALINSLEGESTAEIERQVALREAQIDGEGRLTAERMRAFDALQRERQEAERIQFARDMSQQIEQQQTLARFGGIETAEYREQVAILQAKERLGGTITAQQEEQVRQLARLTEQNRQASEFNALFDVEIVKNNIRAVQSAMADFFRTTLETGTTSFGDLWDSFKSLAINAIAEVAAAMATRLAAQAFFGGPGGIGGFGNILGFGQTAASLASPFSGIPGAAGAFAPAAAAAPFAFAPAAFAPGFTSGAAPGFVPGSPFVANNFAAPTSGFVAGSAATPFSWGSSVFGPGIAGALGGDILSNFTGLNRTGSSLGGALGAIGGNFLLPGIGGILGGALGGSLLGGALGGLFGEDEFNPRVRIGTGFRNVEGSRTGDPRDRFEQNVRPFEGPFGPVGALDIGTFDIDSAGSQAITKFIGEFDVAIAEALTDRQQRIASRLLQNSVSPEVGFNEFQVGEEGIILLKDRLRTIFQSLLPEEADRGLFQRFFGDIIPDEDNPQLVQELIQRAQGVFNFLKQFEELETGEVAKPPTELQASLREIRDRFSELSEMASTFGLDTSVVDRARRQEEGAARGQFFRQFQEQTSSIQAPTQAEQLAQTFRQQWAQLDISIKELNRNWRALDIDKQERNQIIGHAQLRARRDFFSQSADLRGIVYPTGQERPQGIFSDVIGRQQQMQALFAEARQNQGTLGFQPGELATHIAAAERQMRFQFFDVIEEFVRGPGSELAQRIREVSLAFQEARDAADDFKLFPEGRQKLADLEKEAYRTLGQDIMEVLQGFANAGSAFTGLRDQMENMNEAFAEARGSAGLLGLSLNEISRLQGQARDTIEEQFVAILQGSDTGGNAIDQLADRLRSIQRLFAEAATIYQQFGLTQQEFVEVRDEAIAASRRDVLNVLRGFAGSQSQFAGLIETADQMAEAFETARQHAAAFGISVQQIGEIQAAAAINIREEFLNVLRGFSELGGGGSVGEFLREMRQIDATFEDARAQASRFNVSVEEIERFRAEAVEGAQARLMERLSGLAGESVNPLRQLENEIRGVIDAFNSAREIAAQYGLSVQDLNAMQREAIEILGGNVLERLEQDIATQADRLAQLFNQFIDPLEALQRDLLVGLSGSSPRTQFESARGEFQTVLAGAQAGETDDLAALADAARTFLDAARVGGSGIYAGAFQEVQASVPDILRQLQEQRDQSLEGIPQVSQNIRDLASQDRQAYAEMTALLREIKELLRRQGITSIGRAA